MLMHTIINATFNYVYYYFLHSLATLCPRLRCISSKMSFFLQPQIPLFTFITSSIRLTNTVFCLSVRIFSVIILVFIECLFSSSFMVDLFNDIHECFLYISRVKSTCFNKCYPYTHNSINFTNIL